MKYLKTWKLNESISESDILDNFEYISDKFGKPDISKSKYGDDWKWSLSWDIKLDLSVLQEAHQLIRKIKEISEDIDDVLAASDRLEEYNINMSLTDELKIELVPKNSGNDSFRFVQNFEGRQLSIRINEVERFFNSRGLRVIKWDNESSYNEYNETNDLEIFLNKRDNAVFGEFYRLIMSELNPFREDREYQVSTTGNSVLIYPTEEKSYIEVVRN